jgi:hypothetical protein
MKQRQKNVKQVTFEPGEKHLFLDISSANIDTLVPWLYQCVEIHSTEVFWLLPQPRAHLCFNLIIISEMFATEVFFLVDQTDGSH